MDPISVALNALLMIAFQVVAGVAALIGDAAIRTPPPEPTAIIIPDDRALLPIDEDW